MELSGYLSTLPQEQLEDICRRILRSEDTGDSFVSQYLSEDTSRLSRFWQDHYLKEYIKEGGSKIKFVTGRSGSGVTTTLRGMLQAAREMGYYTVSFSADDAWLSDFREVYLKILSQVDLNRIFQGCADRVIEEMGFHVSEIPEGMRLVDYLGSRNDFLTKRQIRENLSRMFLDNPLLDNNFASCCSLYVGDLLGHPILDPATRDFIDAWMHGDKEQKSAAITANGLSPYRITKFNARHMLRSLCEIIRLSGAPGLVVAVDHMDALLADTGLEKLHYTKIRRDDTYESVRQLIDDIDTMKHVMFLYGFDRKLFDNAKYGITTYQALWMRIQNEIHSERFNCFTDMAFLDDLNRQDMNADVCVALSGKVYEAAQELLSLCPEVDAESEFRRAGILKEGKNAAPMHVLTEDEAKVLLQREPYYACGLPRMVMRYTLGADSLNTNDAESDAEEGVENHG